MTKWLFPKEMYMKCLAAPAGDPLSAETVGLVNELRKLAHMVEVYWRLHEHDDESDMHGFCDTVWDFQNSMVYDDDLGVREMAIRTVKEIREYMKKHGISEDVLHQCYDIRQNWGDRHGM